MASSTGTKCPVCGKSIGVGLVSGTLIQHENKHGERCEGTGMAPVVAAPRSSGSGSGSGSSPATRSRASAGSAAAGRYKPSTGTSVTGAPAEAGGAASGARGAAAPARQAAPARRGVTVRKVEVDQEWLKAREEKQERLRLEREARARARNEIYSTGIGEEVEVAAEETAATTDPTEPEELTGEPAAKS